MRDTRVCCVLVLLAVCVVWHSASAAPPAGAAVELLPETFEMRAFDFDKHRVAVVAFYAPWCENSKALLPHWDRLAAIAADHPVFVGRVDADKFTTFADAHFISFFPTVRVYTARNRKGVQYMGSHTLDALLAYVNKKARTHMRVTHHAAAEGAAEPATAQPTDGGGVEEVDFAAFEAQFAEMMAEWQGEVGGMAATGSPDKHEHDEDGVHVEDYVEDEEGVEGAEGAEGAEAPRKGKMSAESLDKLTEEVMAGFLKDFPELKDPLPGGGPGGMPGMPQMPGGMPQMPGMPGGMPGMPGGMPGMPSGMPGGMPGMPSGMPGMPGMPQMPGGTPFGAMPGAEAGAEGEAKHGEQLPGMHAPQLDGFPHPGAPPAFPGAGMPGTPPAGFDMAAMYRELHEQMAKLQQPGGVPPPPPPGGMYQPDPHQYGHAAAQQAHAAYAQQQQPAQGAHGEAGAGAGAQAGVPHGAGQPHVYHQYMNAMGAHMPPMPGMVPGQHAPPEDTGAPEAHAGEQPEA